MEKKMLRGASDRAGLVQRSGRNGKRCGRNGGHGCGNDRHGGSLGERGRIEPQGALSTAPAQTHPGPPLTLTQTLAGLTAKKYPARVAHRGSEKNQPFRLMTRRAIFLPTVESQRS